MELRLIKTFLNNIWNRPHSYIQNTPYQFEPGNQNTLNIIWNIIERITEAITRTSKLPLVYLCGKKCDWIALTCGKSMFNAKQYAIFYQQHKVYWLWSFMASASCFKYIVCSCSNRYASLKNVSEKFNKNENLLIIKIIKETLAIR